jgi:hypothetical protein
LEVATAVAKDADVRWRGRVAVMARKEMGGSNCWWAYSRTRLSGTDKRSRRALSQKRAGAEERLAGKCPKPAKRAAWASVAAKCAMTSAEARRSVRGVEIWVRAFMAE